MRFIVFFIAVILCIFTSGCGRIYGPVEEAKALMAAKDEVVSEWSRTLKADPSETGIETARRVFEGKKADLTAKKNAVVSAPRGFNVDWSTNLSKHEGSTSDALDALEVHVSAMGGPEPGAKFKDLRKEFDAVTSQYGSGN